MSRVVIDATALREAIAALDVATDAYTAAVDAFCRADGAGIAPSRALVDATDRAQDLARWTVIEAAETALARATPAQVAA